ncbi:hypothetical protein Q5P01_000903 [Channa striata]|uniref:Uncharacterized protein n=1 Tax=Channa striata TaxID=64152 RepID=A0AA88LEK2_CHASR|nr:hypothetical protein Q5P01_000903 [Channa striata]
MMFNQEKARVSAAVAEEERRKLRKALPPAGGDRREARPTAWGNKIAGTWIAGSSRRTARYSSRRTLSRQSRGRRSSRTWTRATAAVRSAGPGTLRAIRVHLRRAGGERLAALREACRVRGSEADTLLVELANALEGAVTVCRGRLGPSRGSHGQREEGLTLRLDNRSYREDRAMHDSPRRELLGRTRESAWLGSSARRRELEAVASSPVRRAARRRRAAARAQELHEDLAHPGGPREPHSLSPAGDLNSFALELQKPRGAAARTRPLRVGAVRHRRSGEETPTRAASSQKKKRKRRRDPGSGADGAEAMLGEPRKRVTVGMARMAKAYVNGAVPRASHARFLRLSRVGRHMFLRVKTAVVRDERVRAERVLFMALCGTDYSVTPVGLGIKRLLTGAVANRDLFSSWCAQLERSLWAPPDGTREEAREPPDFHGMAVALAGFTGIPPKIRDKHWTGAKCELMFRTLKYVCDLWALKKPQIGPEYGFSVPR